jgi:hypothetical protein
MVDVLNTFLPPEVRAFIEYKEWSIKTAQGVKMFVERGGRVVPTLCINGIRSHEGLIPTLDELYEGLARGARNAEQCRILEEAHAAARDSYAAGGAGGAC